MHTPYGPNMYYHYGAAGSKLLSKQTDFHFEINGFVILNELNPSFAITNTRWNMQFSSSKKSR